MTPIARYVLLLRGPDSAPAEEGSDERWRAEQETARRLVAEVLDAAGLTTNALLPEGYSLRRGPLRDDDPVM